MTDRRPRTPRYCDLVMKGGITSGLVYPQAVIELGRSYRFKNIGGTSAGAIAAALSAAAALGERRLSAGGSTGGLARLARTAGELSTAGKIFSLFQPAPKLRRAYRLLTRLSARPSKPAVIALVLVGSVAIAPLSFLAVAAALLGLAYLIAGAPGLYATAVPSLACALAFAVYRAASGTADRLRDGLLGMCPGTAQGGRTSGPGLSDWMHTEIRALAGVGEADGPPVLFEELWNAPLYADEPQPRAGERTLSLEVITTDVSHSEPRTLPFARGTLWYREDEMLRLFPRTVVAAMVEGDGTTLNGPDGTTYRQLPPGGKLPIVVAARMSLSFPVLICAVPLWEQHFLPKATDERMTAADAAPGPTPLGEATEELTAAVQGGAPSAPFEMRVCWFTDGGVSSNFPLHLFDAPMPRWPTFAIDLVYPSPGSRPSASPVFLPSGNDQGWRQRYTSIERDGGLQAMGAFLFGIVATMQNWRDLLQGRAPGHRDRVVQVEIEPDEGGMNLNMPPEVLEALAGKGRLAGEALGGFDFENHFWVRYRNLQAAMERYGVDLSKGLATAPAGAEEAYRRALDGKPSVGPYPYNVGQAREAARRLDDLLRELETWADWDGSLAKGAPNPPPSLRIVPTF